MAEPIEKEKRCVLGVDPNAQFEIPFVFGDFMEAPDLEEIGAALIATCDEFERIRWAMQETELKILYRWRKKAAKQADRYKAGTLQKAGGLVKHLADSEYIVQIAADANRGATNWHMEALVYHELKHIKIEVKLIGSKEDAVPAPDPKVRAHDLEMFLSEVDRYGLWRSDLERALATFQQAPLFADAAMAGVPGKA